jgi:phospholipase/lecithinase/hemolysin
VNAAVDKALAEIASLHDVRLHRLDVRAMAERARADPGSFGFVDVRNPCMLAGRCEAICSGITYIRPRTLTRD